MKHQELEVSNGRTNAARFPGRAIVIGMLVAAPWMLGAIAGWSQALLCLCGLVALAFWWLEIAVLRPKQIIMPLSVLPILLGIGLGILHFAPLPDSVANSLGAEHAYQQWEQLATPTPMDQVMVDRMTGLNATQLLNSPTRSISIDPNATRLMTSQLVLAAICYLLGAHFFHDRKSLTWLCIFLTINGVAISLFAIVQKMHWEEEMYFGILSRTGLVFGPYVNRNNASGLLVMCLAAAVMLTGIAFESESKENSRVRSDLWFSILELVHGLNARKLACIFSIVFMFTGIVVSLSRGGTLAAVAGTLVTLLVMGVNKKDTHQGSMLYLIGALLLGALFVGFLGFGDKLLERFEQADRTDLREIKRVENWSDTAELIPDQWLFGSGLSTYQHVHRPLRSSVEYKTFFFAENQYFQAIIDGGLVGFLFLISMLAWSIYLIRYLAIRYRKKWIFAVSLFGTFAISSQMVASFFDFGIYIPANMMTFAVLMGAIAGVAQGHAMQSGAHRNRLPSLSFGRVGIVLLLILFSAGMMSMFQFYRLFQVQTACVEAKQLINERFDAKPEQVESSLTELSRLSGSRIDVEVQKYLAELTIFRFRLKQFQQIVTGQSDISEEVAAEVWGRTSPVASSIYLRQLSEVNSARAASLESEFRTNSELNSSVLPAYEALLRGRSISPFTPEVHLRLAEIGSVLSDASPKGHVDRAVSISPSNPLYQMLAGVYVLRNIKFDRQVELYEPAIQRLRKAIELDANLIKSIEEQVVQKNILGAWVYGIPPSNFARQLLMEHPSDLLRFMNSNEQLRNNRGERSQIMQAAIDAAVNDTDVRYWKYSSLLAIAKMADELEDWEVAAEFGELASRKILNVSQATYIRMEALIQLGNKDEARRLSAELPPNKAKKYTDRINQLQ